MPLSLSKISKRFDNRWVLRDVTLEIEDGEVFGIFGPSGSGKSSLLDIVSGREIPSPGGTIRFSSVDKTSSLEFHRFAPFQGSVWHSFVWWRKRERLDGQGRFGTLEAILTEASGLVLMDDPFYGMDWSLRARACEKMRWASRERDATVVFASSDYREIMAACDRVGILMGGEIKQVGSPQDIYENPASASIARIVERNNLFPARRLTSSKSELPEYQTADGSHRLFAQKIERSALAPINQTVTLGIRPEQISLSFGASFPEDNLLKAKVVGIEFMGATSMIRFNSEGLVIDALVLRVVGLSIGDECMIGLPPDRIQVFRD